MPYRLPIWHPLCFSIHHSNTIWIIHCPQLLKSPEGSGSVDIMSTDIYWYTGINEAVQQIIYYIYYTHYTVCTGSQSEITILNNTILKVTPLCLWLFAAWSCNSLHTVFCFFFVIFIASHTAVLGIIFFNIFWLKDSCRLTLNIDLPCKTLPWVYF